MKVKDALVKLNRKAIADPDDEALVQDLVSMPPETRQRQLDRISKTPFAPGEAQATHLSRSLDGAVANNGLGGGKRMTKDVMTQLQRSAVANKQSFEQAAALAGYDLNAK